MDIVACPPLFRFQVHMAQAADLVVVGQTLHWAVHDPNSTGDRALWDTRQRFLVYLKGLWAPEERTETDGFSCTKRQQQRLQSCEVFKHRLHILIKWVVPLVINPFLITIDYFKTYFAQYLQWVKVNHVLKWNCLFFTLERLLFSCCFLKKKK